MSDVLDRICADKRLHVARRKVEHPLSSLENAAADASPTRGFTAALERAVTRGDYGLIAEIKRASPSKGIIRADFDVADLACCYQNGGASCLSVLTDGPYFRGADEFIGQARAASTLPVLRKDFIVDVYQIVESRAIGADCVLLIMAVLDDVEAREFESAANDLSMDVLVEVHDEAEMDRALRLASPLIGINNRNLKTLEIDLSVTERLVRMVPDGRLTVSESGLETADDLARMAELGVGGFLVGSSLMGADDVEAATRSILARKDSEK